MESRTVTPRESLAVVGDAMNILNGVASAYPDAISLAAGRPAIEFARLGELDRLIELSGDLAFQYGPTEGHIREHLAKALARDEDVNLDPASFIVTNGAQEALLLLLMLFDRSRDALVVPDPCYVGITGAAAVLGLTVHAVPADACDPTNLQAACEGLEGAKCQPRALYLTPDFANPLGNSIGAPERVSLLSAADRFSLLVIEDSPYRGFRYEGPRLPTLLKLARPGAVAHVGTVSKTISAGLRVGFIAWPNADPTEWAALVRAKSFVSVATSPLAQSVAAGVLTRSGFSLEAASAGAALIYKDRRDVVCNALASEFRTINGVTWAPPLGGFFVSVRLPFEFTPVDMTICAREHGVIVCPMALFSITGRWRHWVRIAFSSVEPASLQQGVRRFASYVRKRGAEQA